MATRKKDYKKENNLDSKWMTWMTHLAPWDNVKTVHFFTFFATVGNLRSLYWKIKAQKNKQALVVRFIVFAIWEEFMTELEKHLELRVCRATTITVTPSFTWSFFKVVYIAVNCTKFEKNCMAHPFQKNNLPEKFLRRRNNKGCKYVKYVCKKTYGNQCGELLWTLGLEGLIKTERMVVHMHLDAFLAL